MNDIAKFFVDSIAENSGDIAMMKEQIAALEAKVEKFTSTNSRVMPCRKFEPYGVCPMGLFDACEKYACQLSAART